MRTLQKAYPYGWVLILLLLISSCSQKCIVVSDSSIYHVKSGKIIAYEDAKQFDILDQMVVSSRSLKSLESSDETEFLYSPGAKKKVRLFSKD